MCYISPRTNTTGSNTYLSYLDVSISICGGTCRFVTEVFDKRDSFNFDIVNYPYTCVDSY